jgi:dihydrofolate reductase
MPAGDPFGDLMDAPKKYVVSRTLETPIWRDTTIIRDHVVDAVRALKVQPGGTIMTDGSSQLVPTLLAHGLVDELHLLVYPLTLGRGKRIWSADGRAGFALKSASRTRRASWGCTTCGRSDHASQKMYVTCYNSSH